MNRVSGIARRCLMIAMVGVAAGLAIDMEIAARDIANAAAVIGLVGFVATLLVSVALDHRA